jgi:CheY-like chemotaxis protein
MSQAFSYGQDDRERTIYAVDDDVNARILLGRLLAQPGLEYPVLHFASGEEIIDALLRVLRGAADAPPPLACLLDVKMPGMSGFDVLRWIRCQSTFDQVPVIMLSSADEPDKLLEAQTIGAQCYLAKIPPQGQLRDVIMAAQRFVEASATHRAFELPCNLLARKPSATRAHVSFPLIAPA